MHWHTLEKGKGPVAAGVAVAAAAPQQAAQPSNVRQYPSSKGPKDWSKVEGERVVTGTVTACFGVSWSSVLSFSPAAHLRLLELGCSWLTATICCACVAGNCSRLSQSSSQLVYKGGECKYMLTCPPQPVALLTKREHLRCGRGPQHQGTAPVV
jgi:hypothetical protein